MNDACGCDLLRRMAAPGKARLGECSDCYFRTMADAAVDSNTAAARIRLTRMCPALPVVQHLSVHLALTPQHHQAPYNFSMGIRLASSEAALLLHASKF